MERLCQGLWQHNGSVWTNQHYLDGCSDMSWHRDNSIHQLVLGHIIWYCSILTYYPVSHQLEKIGVKYGPRETQKNAQPTDTADR